MTSVYDVLSKEEIEHFKKNKDFFLEQNQCHSNAAKITIALSKKYRNKVEFCEGSMNSESNNPVYGHCWNRVMKNGKWYYIDLTTEILNETRTGGAHFLLFETWTVDQICEIFDNEGFAFVPFKGCSDWGDELNSYYTKGEDGNPVRNTEANDWKVLCKRYGIEVKIQKLSEVLAKQSA